MIKRMFFFVEECDSPRNVTLKVWSFSEKVPSFSSRVPMTCLSKRYLDCIQTGGWKSNVAAAFLQEARTTVRCWTVAPHAFPKFIMVYLSFFCKDPNDWNNAITPPKSVDFSRHHEHLEEDNSKRLDAKLQLKCSWFLFSPQKEWNRSVSPVLVSNILTQIPRASCFAIPRDSCFTRLASWNSSKSVVLFQL